MRSPRLAWGENPRMQYWRPEGGTAFRLEELAAAPWGGPYLTFPRYR